MTAAQQALEKAEARLLHRSDVASRVEQPNASLVLWHISEAFDAIGNHNLSNAQGQIDLAMSGVSDHRN